MLHHSIYPETVRDRFRVRIPNACIYPPPKNRVNRRRPRWPMIALSFILGLLAGWLLRGGGAWMP